MKISSTLFIAVSVAISTIACDPASQAMPPPGDNLNIILRPWDLATGADPVVQLVVRSNNDVESIAVSRLDALSNGTTLTQLRSGRSVSFSETRRVVSTFIMELNLTASEPLPGGWYELSLHYRDTDGFLPSSAITQQEGGLNVASVRFFNGSLPLLRAQAERDTTRPGAFLVELATTEPSRLSAGHTSFAELLTVRSAGNVVDCTLLDAASVNEQLANPSFVSVSCNGVDGTSLLEVEVSPGIESLSGVPLRDLNGQVSPASVSWTPGPDGSPAPAVLGQELLALTAGT